MDDQNDPFNLDKDLSHDEVVELLKKQDWQGVALATSLLFGLLASPISKVAFQGDGGTRLLRLGAERIIAWLDGDFDKAASLHAVGEAVLERAMDEARERMEAKRDKD